MISIERSHDNSGNDTDSYWSIFVVSNYSSLGGGINFSQVIYKSSLGGAAPFETGAGAIHTVNTQQSQSYNNSVPVLPVFPLAGYVGNPSTNCISMRGSDTGEGAIITTTLYGNQIPFYMSARGACSGFGSTTSGYAAGIRWN